MTTLAAEFLHVLLLLLAQSVQTHLVTAMLHRGVVDALFLFTHTCPFIKITKNRLIQLLYHDLMRVINIQNSAVRTPVIRQHTGKKMSQHTYQRTASPQIRASAAFQPYTATGKLNADITPTIPIGFHCSSNMCPGPGVNNAQFGSNQVANFTS